MKPMIRCLQVVTASLANVGLKRASFTEAVVTLETDYDMVEHSDAHKLADFLKSSRDFDVFWAGSRVTAGVIVNEYDGSG